MLKIKTIILTDDDDNVGYPLFKDGEMVLCPKCNIGHLFVKNNNNMIECTYQPNCNFITENNYDSST